MEANDIWRLNLETNQLTLVQRTNDKFHTFIDQDNKLILKTNDTKKEISDRISSNGGLTAAKDFYDAVGDLGNAIRKDKVAFNDMVSRAGELGFSSKGVEDLKTTGEHKMINGVINVLKDGLAGKAAGESIFSTAKDIVDAPKTYQDLFGSTPAEHINAAGKFLKDFQLNMSQFFKNLREDVLTGARNMQNGSF